MRIPRMFVAKRTGTVPARHWAMMIALAAATGSAAAASWQVAGPANALPREIIALEIRASGDSAMVAGQVTFDFDEALFAVAPNGQSGSAIVGINGGDCRLVGTRTIVVASPAEPQVFPSEPTSFCSATLQVRDRVPTSITRFRLADAECVDSAGTSLPCGTEDLSISVTGNLPAPGLGTVYLDNSQYAEVMLRQGEGIPTVDEVLAFDIARDDHPITALRGTRLLGVSALIQPRATGEYRRLLERHPDAARSRLERYVVVRVPGDVDFRSLIERLRADPVVEAAFGTLPVQLPIPAESTVKPRPSGDASSSHAVEGPKSVANQYHLQQLNLPAAWQLTLGWGHVGIADTGVDTGHLDLVPFLPSGQFIGGETSWHHARSIRVGLGRPAG